MSEKLGTALMLLAALHWTTACTTIDRDKLKKVKSVAIIGFAGQIKEDGDGLQQFVKAMLDQKFGPKFYRMTQNQLKSSMGWTVLNRENLQKAAIYKAAAKKGGNKAANALEYYNKRILIPGVLSDIMAANFMRTKKPRDQLVKELGVDALMTIRFDINREEMSSSMADKAMRMVSKSGVKIKVLECNLSLEVIDAKTGATIWDQPGIHAKGGDTPSLQIFGIPFADLKQRAVASAFSNALAAHIREVKVGD